MRQPLKSFLSLFSIAFFLFCAGCIEGTGQRFNLNSVSYNNIDVLSFNPVGFYSTKNFALAFSRSSVFSEVSSKRDLKLLSLSGLLLSDYVENTIVEYLNLKFNQARGYRIEYRTADPYSQTGTVKVSGLVIAPLSSPSSSSACLSPSNFN